MISKTKKYTFLVLCFLFFLQGQAQQIELEHIWKKFLFHSRPLDGINWMNDGTHFTVLDGGIKKYSVNSDEMTTILEAADTRGVKSYSFNDDESKMILTKDVEPIYRYSSRANHIIYDIATGNFRNLSDKGKQMYPSFAPKGDKMAFVRANNIFIKDLASGEEVQVTDDGEHGKIINGASDWVYEEEFELTKTYVWSPDGSKIAFLKFDESRVKEYTLQRWEGNYPQNYMFKYPKAGEENAVVSIHIYDLATQAIKKVDLGKDIDSYIPRIQWTKDNNLFSIRWMNRLQNKLELWHINATTLDKNKVYEVSTNTYIKLNDDLTYLNDGKHFVLTSERDGWNHIYLYKMNGDLVRQVTKGDWLVDFFFGIDEEAEKAYYISTEESFLERHLYSIGLDGKNKQQLTSKAGTHEIDLSPTFAYYIDNFSTVNDPFSTTIVKTATGDVVKTVADNAMQKSFIESSFDLGKLEFFDFKNDAGVKLNGYMIKPPSFDKKKKYPVLFHIYGGPGVQLVQNHWLGLDHGWHNMLAQKGYIVVVVDTRGSEGRGVAFNKATYAQLGKLELEDLIATAKYLGEQKYIDKDRMGIMGWSYGGYMASLCMVLAPEYFKLGIAVAPVTNWRFYDTIYTERFLKTPQENASGYDDYSPLNYADKLKGHYMIAHGTDDDNVHIQNTYAMQEALIEADKDFTSYIYPNHNHSIFGGNARMHLYKMMNKFIGENL